jgi:hypothetical protein
MRKNQRTTRAVVLMATLAVTSSGLLARQPAPKPAGSAAMAQVEAKLARFRDLIRPQKGEYATNIAGIAWERDPWQAAVKAGREGKPVIAYGVHSAGVTCGYG